MGKKKRRKHLNYLNIALLIALLACFARGGYALYDNLSAKNKDNEIKQDEQPNLKQSDDTEDKPNPDIVIDTREKPENNAENSPKEAPEDVPTSSVNSADWHLQLVNKTHPLPEDFEVKLTALSNGHWIDERAYPELQQMMDDARADGHSVLICSSYRFKEKQISLFENQITRFKNEGYDDEEAKVKAAEWVAIPGTSEHELGLAVDIVSVDNQVLTSEQEDTPEQQWLMANCYKYGFILRYPKDKTDVTGITYEPWHYRYVGKDIAKYITENGLCLEEYLQMQA